MPEEIRVDKSKFDTLLRKMLGTLPTKVGGQDSRSKPKKRKEPAA
jgi:hypothetical protein